MAASSDVSAGDTATAVQYNNLRADAINATTSHTHTGAANNGTVLTLGGAITDVTIPVAQLNQLTGLSANVTDTNLNTIVAGATSDADALHTHDSLINQFLFHPCKLATADPMYCSAYSDAVDYYPFIDSNADTFIAAYQVDVDYEERNITSDWADADYIKGVVAIGNYLYVQAFDSGATINKVYRFAKNDLASAGTQMTYASFGATSIESMFSDGQYLYFTNQAGNSANDYSIRRLSINGTTLDNASDFSLSDSTGFTAIQANSNYIFTGTTGQVIRKYSLVGVYQESTTSVIQLSGIFVGHNDAVYFQGARYDDAREVMIKIPLSHT